MKRDEYRIATVEGLEKRLARAGDLVETSLASSVSHQSDVSAFCPAYPPAHSVGSLSVSSPGHVYEQVAADDPLDISGDGQISPSDVDTILFELDRHLSSADSPEPPRDLDVNSDGQATPLDALVVINRVNFYSSLVPCNCNACLASALVE